jgi:hypothetical protein
LPSGYWDLHIRFHHLDHVVLARMLMIPFLQQRYGCCSVWDKRRHRESRMWVHSGLTSALGLTSLRVSVCFVATIMTSGKKTSSLSSSVNWSPSPYSRHRTCLSSPCHVFSAKHPSPWSMPAVKPPPPRQRSALGQTGDGPSTAHLHHPRITRRLFGKDGSCLV